MKIQLVTLDLGAKSQTARPHLVMVGEFDIAAPRKTRLALINASEKETIRSGRIYFNAGYANRATGVLLADN